MSEKRFSWKTEKLQHSNDEVLLVVDNENKDWKGHILNIVDLLNEQQDKISELEEELEKSSAFIIEQRKENKKLNEENEKLRKELDNFKPVMFQDMRKGTVILYSEGD